MTPKVVWHAVNLTCPKCSGTFTIVELSANCMGGVRADGVCVACGIELGWESTMAHLICSALICDFAEAGLQLGGNTPPPAPPTHNKDDDDFLHDLGIDPGGGK